MIDGEGAATAGGGQELSFGVVVPAFGPLASRRAFNDAVDTIEGLGFEDVWFGDHVAVPSYAAHLTRPEWLEPLSACMLALGRTTRLRAGTDVLVLPYRDPLLVAKMAATADVLSGGRLVLGIGVGYLKGEFEALGADYGRRGSVTDQYLRVMQVLWGSAGTPVSFDTEFVRFNDVCMGPPPTTGQVPVWVGGNARGALRRAALMGDGWHPLFPTPDLYRSGRDTIVALRGSGDQFPSAWRSPGCSRRARPTRRGHGATTPTFLRTSATARRFLWLTMVALGSSATRTNWRQTSRITPQLVSDTSPSAFLRVVTSAWRTTSTSCSVSPTR